MWTVEEREVKGDNQKILKDRILFGSRIPFGGGIPIFKRPVLNGFLINFLINCIPYLR